MNLSNFDNNSGLSMTRKNIKKFTNDLTRLREGNCRLGTLSPDQGGFEA